MTPPRFLLFALATSAPLAPACAVGGGDLSWDLPADVEGVDLRVGNGSITVLPGDDDRIHIEWSGGGIGNQNVHPEPELIGDVVYLDARCGDACGGDITVWLPPGLDVLAEATRGDIEISMSRRADIRACVAAGAVILEVPAGAYDLDLSVGAGDLTIEGVGHDPSSSERIEACTAAGDLEVFGT